MSYRADEILGQSSSRFFIPEDLSVGEHEKELLTAISQGQASDDRWQVRKDGSRFWASGLTIALKGHDLRGFAKVMRDLTEMRQATDEVRRLNAELQQTVSNLEKTKAELEEKVHDLERFEEAVVGRELKMMQLEKEIEALREENEKLRQSISR